MSTQLKEYPVECSECGYVHSSDVPCMAVFTTQQLIKRLDAIEELLGEIRGIGLDINGKLAR